jgi:2',3'-cyclic-nucleotide 2'-phosphodiesterase (5'-nucleotidase family)
MMGDIRFPTGYSVSAPFQAPSSALPALQGDLSSLQVPADAIVQPVDMASISHSEKSSSSTETGKKPAKPKKPSAKEDPKPPSDTDASAGSRIKIPIIHTNDLHGAVNHMADLENAIHRLKSVNPDAVLIDSGDAGNTANDSDPDRFEDVVKLFNDEGYLAVAPGNHEFQWSKDVAIKEYFSKLNAKVLSANLLDRDTGKPLAKTVPHVIEDIKGVNVGFVGITTTKMSTPQHPDMGKDVIALPETEALMEEVKKMKAEGAQVIVGLVHKGINDIRKEGEKLTAEEEQLSLKELHDLAVKVPDIDVIAAGHDHKKATLEFETGPFPHKTYIVEAGSHGDEVGEIDLYVDRKTKKVVDADMKIYPVKNFQFTADDDVVKK